MPSKTITYTNSQFPVVTLVPVQLAHELMDMAEHFIPIPNDPDTNIPIMSKAQNAKKFPEWAIKQYLKRYRQYTEKLKYSDPDVSDVEGGVLAVEL